MSNKRFQDYLNQYSRHQIDSIHVDKFDMSKELGFLEDYFTKSCKVEKLQSMRQIEYKEVHSLQEQKQQKQIQQLEIKIQQLIKEQNDFENANKELYKDVKRQKYLIKSYQRDKIQFEKNKKVWDQKLIKMEEIYKTTQELADNQKAVLSLINDDIDKQALIEAKRIKRT